MKDSFNIKCLYGYLENDVLSGSVISSTLGEEMFGSQSQDSQFGHSASPR